MNYKQRYLNFLKNNDLSDDLHLAAFLDYINDSEYIEDCEQIIKELERLPENKQQKKALDLAYEHYIIMSSKIERSSMKLGLHRMKKILSLLDNPEKNLKVIHVAGTNGKGSTSNFIKDILKTKYRVGFYSSPGMISFNDRIRVNDILLPYYMLYRQFKSITNLWYSQEDTDEDLSFFEILTVCAIQFFNDMKTDFVVMEVGLGGRFDGTNIFEDKLLSIITKIGLDHTAILGNTLEKIAYEKGGIIKNNNNVIMYPAEQSVVDVIKNICHETNSTLEILNEKDIKSITMNKYFNQFSYKNFTDVKIKMLGEHQIYNASLALMAINNLKERNIITLSNDEIITAISNSTWAGRLEWIRENILLDGAHNIDGIKSLINYIEKNNFKKLKIAVGILDDKDYNEMITLLSQVDATFYATKVPVQFKSSNLENLANSFNGIELTTFDNYVDLVDNIVPQLDDDTTLIVTGSLYLISAVRSYITETF